MHFRSLPSLSVVRSLLLESLGEMRLDHGQLVLKKVLVGMLLQTAVLESTCAHCADASYLGIKTVASSYDAGQRLPSAAISNLWSRSP